MKKNGIAAIVALLAVAYPASAWLIGKNIESSMADYRAKALAHAPYIKIVKQDYQRGVFSSTEKMSVEFAGDMLRSFEDMAKAEKLPKSGDENGEADAAATEPPAPPTELAKPPEPIKPLIITFVNHISHGPFAGGKPAMGVVNTTLEFDEKVTQELVKVFGNNKPLEIVTTMGWGGSGTGTITSPATIAPFKRGAAEMNWQGLKGTVDFTKDMATYHANFTVPGIAIKDTAKNEELKFSGFEMVSDKKRLSENSLLFLGKDSGTVKSITSSGKTDGGKSFVLDDLTYSGDTNESAGFVDIIAKIGAAKLRISPDSYGPIHYDFSAKHLKSDILDQLFKSFGEIYSGHYKTQAEFTAATLAPWKKYGVELLKHNPQFVLDRLSFAMPEGEAKFSADVKAPGATAEDINNPVMLLGKLDASADIALPEAMVTKMSGSGNKSPEEQAEAKAQFEQQITGLEQQGYIVRENKILKSRFKFKDGKATINDKPFQLPGSTPS